MILKIVKMFAVVNFLSITNILSQIIKKNNNLTFFLKF